VDATNNEQDDLLKAGSSGTVCIKPDCDYQWTSWAYAIPSKRDLEDYTRLWIPGVKKLYEAHTNLTFELSVRNNDQLDGPAINLVLAVEADGDTRYLTDTSVANQQITLPSGKFVGRIGPGSTIRLNDFFNLALYPGTGAENFIWCGARRGKGELVLQVRDGTSLLAETSLWLDLKDIKEMFECWTVGDIGSKEPWVRATNAVEGLPQFVGPFRYDAPTDTNTPYILHVHGWNMEGWEKDRFAETMYKRLYWQGYQGRFGSFRWPTRSGFDMVSWQNPATVPNHFDRSEFNAWKSALGLGWLLIDLKNNYPGHVHLAAHSMGNIAAGEALRITNTNATLVKTYVAMQAAVASHAYDGSAPTRTVNFLRDDSTPNRYAHYYQSNSPPYFNGVVGAVNYINFYNTNDYALAAIRWQLDQDLKPAGTIGYGYTPDNGKFYKEYYGTELVFPTDTYEIFSFCDEARCYALGAQPNVGGPFQTANQVDLSAAPFNFGAAHKGHSAQFRSTNMERAAFWNRFLIRAGLKEE
jgi:hypothetical protein